MQESNQGRMGFKKASSNDWTQSSRAFCCCACSAFIHKLRYDEGDTVFKGERGMFSDPRASTSTRPLDKAINQATHRCVSSRGGSLPASVTPPPPRLSPCLPPTCL